MPVLTKVLIVEDAVNFHTEREDVSKQKCPSVLRDGLRGLVEGSLKVEHNFVATIYGVSLDWSESKREALHQGYLFLDLCSLPQILDLGTGSVDFTNTDASLAVQSIPAYVERCDLFIALAPELTHADSGAHCNYTTWLTRGWCRAELWYRTLSNRKNTSVIVMLSAVEAECMFYQNKYQTRIVDGQFTVEEDRAVLTRLGEEATDKKIKHLRSRPDDLHWYRYFVALRNRWVGQPNRTWTVPDFLEHFMFDSLADAAIDGSHMFGLLCAVVAGDCSMVRALVSAQADVNRQVSGLADMGFYPGITPLMVAAISEQSGPVTLGAGFGPLHAAGLFSRGNPEALDMARLLIMQRADVNVPARPTMLFGLICGLSQSRANLCGFDACPARTRFFASLPGLTPLGIAASVGSETLVNLLLEHRAEPEQPNGRGDVPRYLALANGHKHVYALLEDTFSI
ncbi:ANK_REP_REGION domain-containing protein [Durusdinium trenchii]|uniref:ANK_REP_REGION domain-containing protein n=1 Tax=Durusdinium trenchii TaxID=1381693 RepID=A0ABP0JJZ5_9DINO